jgi:hypothetical protein
LIATLVDFLTGSAVAANTLAVGRTMVREAWSRFVTDVAARRGLRFTRELSFDFGFPGLEAAKLGRLLGAAVATPEAVSEKDPGPIPDAEESCTGAVDWIATARIVTTVLTGCVGTTGGAGAGVGVCKSASSSA